MTEWGEVDNSGSQWGIRAFPPHMCIKMDATERSAKTYYNSVYRHGVDEKRRVQVPAKWRPSRAGVEFTLMLWPKSQEGPCLRVLPPEPMAKLVRTVDDMSNSDPNKVVLKRFIGSESVQVTLDKGGRICLPEEMARAAGIQDEAVLVGLLDRFEIWNPTRYEKVRSADAVMAQQAFKLME